MSDCRSSPAFSGTTDKCDACGKRVYPMELLAADARVYHRTCFRCAQCRATLQFSNYSSIDGVLYCKPHYDQLMTKAGNALEVASAAAKPARDNRSSPGAKAQSGGRFSSFFTGTRELCTACGKTVYPLEKVALDGNPYHKACFRCSHGGCIISLSNHVAHEGKLYCKHHHAQLLLVAGSYSMLEEAEATAKVAPENPAPADKGNEVTEEKPSLCDEAAEKAVEEAPQQAAPAAIETLQAPTTVKENLLSKSATTKKPGATSGYSVSSDLPFEWPKLRRVGSKQPAAATGEGPSESPASGKKAPVSLQAEEPTKSEPAKQQAANDDNNTPVPLQEEPDTSKPVQEATTREKAPPEEGMILKEPSGEESEAMVDEKLPNGKATGSLEPSGESSAPVADDGVEGTSDQGPDSS